MTLADDPQSVIDLRPYLQPQHRTHLPDLFAVQALQAEGWPSMSESDAVGVIVLAGIRLSALDKTPAEPIRVAFGRTA